MNELNFVFQHKDSTFSIRFILHHVHLIKYESRIMYFELFKQARENGNKTHYTGNNQLFHLQLMSSHI